jgi:hypothetical protein
MSGAPLLSLMVVLGAYRVDAMHDDFGDGTWQSFDAVEMLVVDGPRAGTEIVALVDPRNAAQVTRWNRPGATLHISVAADVLDTADTLFVGALTIAEAQP